LILGQEHSIHTLRKKQLLFFFHIPPNFLKNMTRQEIKLLG